MEARDRARRASGPDPYASLDVKSLPNEDLVALKDRHTGVYNDDPHSAALVGRIFAELDERERCTAQDGRTPEEKRVDALIA